LGHWQYQSSSDGRNSLPLYSPTQKLVVDYATIALSTERFSPMQAPNTHNEATATAKNFMVQAEMALEQKP
jgi:hypothetical protein